MKHRRQTALRVSGALLVAVGVFAAFSALLVLSALGNLAAGRSALERSVAALEDMRAEDAEAQMAEAVESLCTAARRVRGPAGGMWARWPGVGTDVAGVRSLAIGSCEAATGAHGVLAVLAGLPGGIAGLGPVEGELPIEAYAALAGPLEDAADALDRAHAQISRGPSQGLHNRVAQARTAFLERVGPARGGARTAATLARVMPEFLGASGVKRYLVAAQNPAELRGTGGFAGAYSIMETDGGRLSFRTFVSIHELTSVGTEEIDPPSADFAERYDAVGGAGFWHNINFSPDFPSVATAMARLYEHTEGEAVDGVIAVSPQALAGLMAVAGPVQVPALGTVPATEIVEVMANEGYDLLEGDRERKQALGAVAVAVLNQAFAVDSSETVGLLRALGEAIARGHVLIHVQDRTTQDAIAMVGADGRLRDGEGDHVAVIVNNRGNHKGDYYTDRTLHYDIQLQADGSARTTLTVSLANHTPTEGITSHVIGPNVEGLDAGDNRSRLDVFAPPGAELIAYRRDGDDRGLDLSTELGRVVFTTTVEVASGEEAAVQLEWQVRDAWNQVGEGGRYRLTVQDQPTIRPTQATVRITPPPGMVPVAAAGGASFDERGFGWAGTVEPAHVLEIWFE
jgi:hypothetical protein